MGRPVASRRSGPRSRGSRSTATRSRWRLAGLPFEPKPGVDAAAPHPVSLQIFVVDLEFGIVVKRFVFDEFRDMRPVSRMPVPGGIGRHRDGVLQIRGKIPV